MALIVETTKREVDDREVTCYQAVLNGDNDPCVTGRVQFARWEVWSDDPQEDHDKAKAATLANARNVLSGGQVMENIGDKVTGGGTFKLSYNSDGQQWEIGQPGIPQPFAIVKRAETQSKQEAEANARTMASAGSMINALYNIANMQVLEHSNHKEILDLCMSIARMEVHKCENVEKLSLNKKSSSKKTPPLKKDGFIKRINQVVENAWEREKALRLADYQWQLNFLTFHENGLREFFDKHGVSEEHINYLMGDADRDVLVDWVKNGLVVSEGKSNKDNLFRISKIGEVEIPLKGFIKAPISDITRENINRYTNLYIPRNTHDYGNATSESIFVCVDANKVKCWLESHPIERNESTYSAPGM
jgi:hypothetical protein